MKIYELTHNLRSLEEIVSQRLKDAPEVANLLGVGFAKLSVEIEFSGE